MNTIYIIGIIWSTISIIGITNSLIYKYCKRTLNTGAQGTNFQRFYAYKFYYRSNCIINRASIICRAIWCCILCGYIIKYIWNTI